MAFPRTCGTRWSSGRRTAASIAVWLRRGQEATFHVDHVVPVVAGGQSTAENLALACVSCSLRKGSHLVIVDPDTGEQIALFHPGRDAWRLHFRWDGVPVVGITPTGAQRSWRFT